MLRERRKKNCGKRQSVERQAAKTEAAGKR